MAADYVKVKRKIDNAWHEQNYARWTNDPNGKWRRSTEVRPRPKGPRARQHGTPPDGTHLPPDPPATRPTCVCPFVG